MKPKSDETLDSIKGIKLFQAKDGYRFSIDALMLEHFIKVKYEDRGIELGAGSGVISILLAKRSKNINIKAVEIQQSLALRAKRNVQLNKMNEKIEVIEKDIKELKSVFSTNTFDFAFSNPPFRKPKSGRISKREEKAVARHEIELNLPDLINTAAYLLNHSGRLYIIYHPFRLIELISHLRKARLEPKRIRFVHSRKSEEAKMVLIESVKGSGIWLKVEPPLYIHEEGKAYSSEVQGILNS